MKLGTLLILLVTLGMLAPPAGAQSATAPRPRLDHVGDGSKVVIARLTLTAERATVEGAHVAYGKLPVRSTAPRQLGARLISTWGAILEEYTEWNPLVTSQWSGGRESRLVRASAQARFLVPFDTRAATLEITDLERQRLLARIDLQPVMRAFCDTHANDQDCTAFLSTPDLAVSGSATKLLQRNAFRDEPVSIAVRNRGDRRALGSGDSTDGYELDVYLSRDNLPPATPDYGATGYREDLVLFHDDATRTLAPGQLRKKSIEITIPADTPSGPVCLLVVARTKGFGQESNSANNAFCIPVTIG
jgi:hypothetical protein